MLKNKRRSFGLVVPHNVQQWNDIGSTRQILQDFDFSFDLFLFHWFQYFHHASFVVYYIHAIKDFTVFATTNFTNDFVIILVAPRYLQVFICAKKEGGVRNKRRRVVVRSCNICGRAVKTGEGEKEISVDAKGLFVEYLGLSLAAWLCCTVSLSC